MQGEVFIHVGLHKTGTTFLQKNIFNELDLRFVRHLNDVVKFPDAKKVLISNEALSGEPFLVYDNADTRFNIADRLLAMFPKSKVIVCTRDVDDWLQSLYIEHIKNGCKMEWEQWMNSINSDYWRHDIYVNYLYSHFYDVFHYTYEDFKKDTPGMVRKICDFIGEEVPDYRNVISNPSLGSSQARLLLYLNQFLTPEELCYSGEFPVSRMVHGLKHSLLRMCNYA